MSSLRAAPVIAVFLACVPAPTLAQSLDQGFHQNAADPLNGGSSLFAKKITDRARLKPFRRRERAPSTTSFPGRWSRLGHQEPKDRCAKQGHRCNTQKYHRATKTHSHQTKECSAERSADT